MHGTTDDGEDDPARSATTAPGSDRNSAASGTTAGASSPDQPGAATPPDHLMPEPPAQLLPGPVTPSAHLMPAPSTPTDESQDAADDAVSSAPGDSAESHTEGGPVHATTPESDSPDEEATGETATEHTLDRDDSIDPALPRGAAVASPAIVKARSAEPRSPTGTWYRNDQDRTKSVRRRANPWYRNLARVVVGLAVLTGLTIGTVFVVREIREALRSESLPPAEADTPMIQSTSFEVRSAAPAPDVDGTITLDVETGAYEFIGRGSGVQAGIQIVSPSGGSVFVRRDDGDWQLAATTDRVASDVQSVAALLADDHNVDEILTTEVRDNFAEAVDRTEIGSGDDQIVRYEVVIDTEAYDDRFPQEFEQFVGEVVPGAAATDDLTITMWIDDENVLVQVRDESGGWSWERLAYSEQPFTPVDPLDELLTGSLDTGEESDDTSDADG